MYDATHTRKSAIGGGRFCLPKEIDVVERKFQGLHLKTTREMRRKVAPLGRSTLICGSSGGGGSIMTQRAGVVNKLSDAGLTPVETGALEPPSMAMSSSW